MSICIKAVPLVPKEDARVASKPGQRKRPLNAKTTTKKRKVTGPYSGNWGETRNIRYRAIVKGMSITGPA
jgi:hypothetical protein